MSNYPYVGPVLEGPDHRQNVDSDAEDGNDGGDEAEASADDQEGIGSGPDPGGGESQRAAGGVHSWVGHRSGVRASAFS